MILLDTNVISELVRPIPHPDVVAFLGRQAFETVFTTAVCEAEVHYGLARMPTGRRRDELSARVSAFFATGFRDRILPFDSPCAALYGRIRTDREAAGKPITVADAMIAAIARLCGAMVVTRNLADFEDCGVELVNPWNATAPGS